MLFELNRATAGVLVRCWATMGPWDRVYTLCLGTWDALILQDNADPCGVAPPGITSSSEWLRLGASAVPEELRSVEEWVTRYFHKRAVKTTPRRVRSID